MLFRKRSRRESFLCVAEKDAIDQIHDNFVSSCHKAGLVVPKGVETEFQLRSARANKSAAKAKFNFKNTQLDDELVIKFFEAIAHEPCVNKLDLQENNLSMKSIAILTRLLKGQAKIIRTIPLDDRLSACYLGKIFISKTNDITAKTLLEIQEYAESLDYANAQTFIRNVYLQNGGPQVIDYALVLKLFEPLMGRLPKVAKKGSFSFRGSTDKLFSGDEVAEIGFSFHGKSAANDDHLTYEQLEASFLHAMIAEGHLIELSDRQKALVTYSPEEASADQHAAQENTPPPPPVEVAPVDDFSEKVVDPTLNSQAQFTPVVVSVDSAPVVVKSPKAVKPNVTPKSISRPSNGYDSDSGRVSLASTVGSVSGGTVPYDIGNVSLYSPPGSPVVSRPSSRPQSASKISRPNSASSHRSGFAPPERRTPELTKTQISSPQVTVNVTSDDSKNHTITTTRTVQRRRSLASSNNATIAADDKVEGSVITHEESSVATFESAESILDVDSSTLVLDKDRLSAISEYVVAPSAVKDEHGNLTSMTNAILKIQGANIRRKSLCSQSQSSAGSKLGFSEAFNERNGVTRASPMFGESSSPVMVPVLSTSHDKMISPLVESSGVAEVFHDENVNDVNRGESPFEIRSPAVHSIEVNREEDNTETPIRRRSIVVATTTVTTPGNGAAGSAVPEKKSSIVVKKPEVVTAIKSRANPNDILDSHPADLNFFPGGSKQTHAKSCYNFSNENICGDDWFIAEEENTLEVEDKVEVTRNSDVSSKVHTTVTTVVYAELLPKQNFQFVKTLILRNNNIECFNWIILMQLKNLVELDLSHNKITHIINSVIFIQTFGPSSGSSSAYGTSDFIESILSPKGKKKVARYAGSKSTTTDLIIKSGLDGEIKSTEYIHRSLQKLDLSYNKIVDSTGLLSLVSLKELNLSNNFVSIPEGLPYLTLERLDISNNSIATAVAFRMLGMCSQLIAIDVEGNPISANSSNHILGLDPVSLDNSAQTIAPFRVKERLCCMLPKLLFVNGFQLARSHEIEKRSVVANRELNEEKKVFYYERLWKEKQKVSERKHARDVRKSNHSPFAVEGEGSATVDRKLLQQQADLKRHSEYKRINSNIEKKREVFVDKITKMSNRRAATAYLNSELYHKLSPSKKRLVNEMYGGGSVRSVDQSYGNNLMVNKNLYDDLAAEVTESPKPSPTGRSSVSRLFSNVDEPVQPVEETRPALPNIVTICCVQLKALLDYISNSEYSDGFAKVVLPRDYIDSFCDQFEILDQNINSYCLSSSKVESVVDLLKDFQWLFAEVCEFVQQEEVRYKVEVHDLLADLLQLDDAHGSSGKDVDAIKRAMKAAGYELLCRVEIPIEAAPVQEDTRPIQEVKPIPAAVPVKSSVAKVQNADNSSILQRMKNRVSENIKAKSELTENTAALREQEGSETDRNYAAEEARRAAEEAKRLEVKRLAVEEAKRIALAEEARRAEAKRLEDAKNALEESRKSETKRLAAEEALRVEESKRVSTVEEVKLVVEEPKSASLSTKSDDAKSRLQARLEKNKREKAEASS